MLFQVYGENAMYQWLGWIMVFVSLIAANEVARRSKTGGIVCFLGIPAVLTVYFIAIYVCAAWAWSGLSTIPTYLAHGQLVPLCQTLRRDRRLHRLHDAQVRLGQTRPQRGFQGVPLCHRRHQHPHRGCL